MPFLASADDQKKARLAWEMEDHEKLLLLCAEMGIPHGPHCFYELSLALARKHHTAFKEALPLGKWTNLAGGYLVVEVERLTADLKPGHSALWACYQLIKRDEWRGFLGTGDDPKNPEREDPGGALRKQYYKFKKELWSEVMRDAFKFHEAQNTVPIWESQMREVLRRPNP
ncbi:hypothetical protein [Hydrogenophaga sp.]|uniref:hypothetical protein n=1 Tax=Hydrogenophaga sp. TaxID=1904254 RepID=UPI00273016B9|nr:hypothetical protein [Hydrogenophaga sp.]MDP1684981.1 hypothetical protein [Hydrogenophaga sp.]